MLLLLVLCLVNPFNLESRGRSKTVHVSVLVQSVYRSTATGSQVRNKRDRLEVGAADCC